MFLKLAVSAGFDWVYYASYDYVRLSVIPDGKILIHIYTCSYSYVYEDVGSAYLKFLCKCFPNS